MRMIDQIDRNKLAPMMRQYVQVKDNNLDSILMYQVGDFYEMFFDDALIVSKVLELTLTGKECGLDERAPMCGIPMHAVDNYVSRLISNGFKVAICSQTTLPGKELVKREIVRIVTPGTVTENLEEKANNFVLAVFVQGEKSAIAFADVTTGEMYAKETDLKKLEDDLLKIKPAEIICNSNAKEFEKNMASFKLGLLPRFYETSGYCYAYDKAKARAKKQYGVQSLSVFDIPEDNRVLVSAIGGLLAYIEETQKRVLSSINKVELIKSNQFMQLDNSVKRHLELFENMTTKKKVGSLIGLLDKTKTAMGGRLLKKYLDYPLQDEIKINDRLDGVEDLMSSAIKLDDVKSLLSHIADIERIIGKLAFGSITPRDFESLAGSTVKALELKQYILANYSAKLLVSEATAIKDLSAVAKEIKECIIENPPMSTKDGGFIKAGYNQQLDDLRNIKDVGGKWINQFEQTLKDSTGIKNLRVAYNRIFGYYIEVSKSQLNMVPIDWVRKQTTVNGERFITADLKEMEQKILTSEVDALRLEAELYTALKQRTLNYLKDFQSIAESVACIDCLASLATVAQENNYVRPTINAKVNKIEIINGRHPVIEQMLGQNQFVANDCLLDSAEDRISIITGPNMAGKSTFMRQVAVITLLAHIGSFVPADKATISITDRIFTRIGASDDLAYGQSTFMVEMTEVSNILHNATANSLILLDEIGRGTSTYDGLSIAWAVVEYLSKTIPAKTLFATHYHELCDLEGKIAGVKNYRVLIRELPNSIVFLHKIARGSANKSFGIEVASLAGIPKEIIERAKTILAIQEAANENATKVSFDSEPVASSKTKQNVNITEVLNILGDVDMDNITPLVAFATLQNLVDKVKKQ